MATQPVNAERLVHPTEFQALRAEGAQKLAPFVQEYPLTSVIMMLAGVVLGLSNLLSLNLVTAVFSISMGGFVGLGIQYNTPAFQKEFMRSFWEVFAVVRESVLKSQVVHDN